MIQVPTYDHGYDDNFDVFGDGEVDHRLTTASEDEDCITSAELIRRMTQVCFTGYFTSNLFCRVSFG